jgi:chromosome segregation ATPase
MLEAWFATLGARLGVAEAETSPADELPEPVRQAALQMWAGALEESKVAMEAVLKERQAAVNAAEKTLKANEQHLAQREEAMHQQKKAMDDAMKLAKSQAQELSRRLEEMQQLLQEREAQIQALRAEITEKNRQREEEQKLHAEALQAASAERQRLADRARQDLSTHKKQYTEAERQIQLRYEQLHERFVRSEEELVQARGAQIHAEQALALSQERIEDLKSLAAARREAAQQSAGAASLMQEAPVRARTLRASSRGGAIKSLRKNRR